MFQSDSSSGALVDEDLILLQQLKDGDGSALKKLMDRHSGYVESIVRLRLNNHPADVPDVIQEVFLAVYKSVRNAQFNGESKFTTWLYQVVNNKCNDFFKNKCDVLSPRRPSATREPLSTALDYAAPLPDLNRSILASQVANLVYPQLDEREHQVLQLMYGDEMRRAQVAEQMALTPSQISEILKGIWKKARRLMQQPADKKYTVGS